MSEPIRRTQYRIMSRRVGERHFRLLPFTGATSGDKERIKKRFAELPQESPEWEFRLEQRTILITEEPWRPA